MLRVLLIDDTPRKVGRLRTALIEAGFDVIEESRLTIDLQERMETLRPDVVLIDTDSPGRDVMEQVVMVSRDQPRPIVMFTNDKDPELMRQAIRAGAPGGSLPISLGSTGRCGSLRSSRRRSGSCRERRRGARSPACAQGRRFARRAGDTT